MGKTVLKLYQLQRKMAEEIPLGVVIIAVVFGIAHSLTGLSALILEKDPSFRMLLDAGPFEEKEPLEGRAKFLRGNKRSGRGTAPNMRAWGTRQLCIGVALFYGAFSGDRGSMATALIAFVTRICGDVLQCLLEGCYWKLAVFLPVEGVMACVLGLFLSGTIQM